MAEDTRGGRVEIRSCVGPGNYRLHSKCGVKCHFVFPVGILSLKLLHLAVSYKTVFALRTR